MRKINLEKINKGFILLINFLAFHLSNSQTCDMSGATPLHVTPPNTSDTIFSQTDIEYLCGPYTVLNFLASQNGNAQCWAFVNSGSTLNLGAQTISNHYVWVKAGATLNLLQGCSLTDLTFEPGAVINNPFAAPTVTHSCMAINFPAVNCSPTNIKESLMAASEITAYPNPFTDKLKLTFSNYLDLSNSEILVYSKTGSLVHKQKVNKLNEEVNLAFLPKGIYYLRIVQDDQIKSIKISKE